jgi:hypothetical protein
MLAEASRRRFAAQRCRSGCEECCDPSSAAQGGEGRQPSAASRTWGPEEFGNTFCRNRLFSWSCVLHSPPVERTSTRNDFGHLRSASGWLARSILICEYGARKTLAFGISPMSKNGCDACRGSLGPGMCQQCLTMPSGDETASAQTASAP